MHRQTTILVCVAALVLCHVVAGLAEIPQTMNYQVMLTNDVGEPLADQIISLAFTIYSDDAGVTDLWTEARVGTTNSIGVVSLALGSVTPIDISFSAPLWLGIEVDGEPLSPLRELTTSPYAFHAADASALGGLASSAYSPDGHDHDDDYVDEGQIDAVDATMIAPDVVSSIDGVSNDGGDIDLVAGSNVTITPDDGANTITIAASPGGGGDITAVYADDGLTGNATTGDAHLVVGEGDGITVTADEVAVDVVDIVGDGLGHDGSNNLTVNTGVGLELDAGAVALTPAYSEGSAYDPRFVNEGQSTSVTTSMVTPDIVSSIDGVSNDGGDVDLVAGSNVTITPDDGANTITIAATGGGDDGDWVVDGDDAYRTTGNVGIGTSTPGFILSVEANKDTVARFTSSSSEHGVHVVHAEHVGGPGDGDIVAVFGKSSDPDYGIGGRFDGGVIGVEGYSEGEHETQTGVQGLSVGTPGQTTNRGVYGNASNGAYNYGVRGRAYGNDASTTNYGIYGEAVGTSALNYAGYFEGNVQVEGSVQVAGATTTEGLKMPTGASYGHVLTSDSLGAGTWQAPVVGDDGDWTQGGPNIHRMTGNVGIGVASPNTRLEVVSTNSAVRIEGGGTSAALTAVASGNGGLAGWFLGSIEVSSDERSSGVFRTDHPGGSFPPPHAVYGEYSYDGESDGVGVHGESVPADGYGSGGVFLGGYSGVEGEVSPTGTGDGSYYGVIGSVDHETTGTGNNYGVLGLGWDNETNFGVRGEARNGTTSYGVDGRAEYATVNYGLRGVAVGGDYAYGVYGSGSSGATVSLAGKFSGDVAVTGTLSKGGGSFKIDHPLDPEGKYLYHSFVESPDMMNVYNGNVMLDAGGEAWVELPEWFEALNRDYRYQLTPIGGGAPNLHIAEKISRGRFKIAGGQPGMEISWQVTGVRQDPFAEENRVRVEVDKRPDEIGKYVHPEAYGKSREEAVDYIAPEPVDPKRADR